MRRTLLSLVALSVAVTLAVGSDDTEPSELSQRAEEAEEVEVAEKAEGEPAAVDPGTEEAPAEGAYATELDRLTTVVPVGGTFDTETPGKGVSEAFRRDVMGMNPEAPYTLEAIGRYDTPAGTRWVLRGLPPTGGLNAAYHQVRAGSDGSLEHTQIAHHSQTACADHHTALLTVLANGDLRLDEAMWTDECPDGSTPRTESMSIVKPDGSVVPMAG